MKRRPHPQTTRLRIEQLEERTIYTTIPKIENIFNRETLDGELCTEMIEKMTFSEYPGIRQDGTIALSALLLNSNNSDMLKRTGSLGAVVELLRKIDVQANPSSQHIQNLVKCLHTLMTSDGDKAIQQRFLSNPYGISTILRLCKYTSGRLQEMSNDLLICVSKMENGIEELLRSNVIGTLMTEEMLFRNSTLISVRRSSANLVHRIAVLKPETYPLDKVEYLALNAEGDRRIDSYQEIQFLYGLLVHWNWLTSTGKNLERVFTLFPHIINEIKSELFESLDHCMLLVKCCVQGSKEISQIEYMLDNDLAVALQYLVRTDFSLYRRKCDPSSVKTNQAKTSASQSVKAKRLSIQDSGERSSSTQIALSMVKPGKVETGGNDDMNLVATKAVVVMYENILQKKIEIISDIVSSGLIPGLLFRVGTGIDKDIRYLKLVVQFIYNILIKVALTNPKKDECINLLAVNPRKVNTFQGLGEDGAQRPMSAKSASYAADLRARMSATDIRSITNTLHAQGVTDTLIAALCVQDELTCISQALMSLSMLVYSVIQPTLCEVENATKVFSHTSSRPECFYPVLSMLCEMISRTREDNVEFLTVIAKEFKGVKILLAGLRLSGWVFPMKGVVYRCLARLSITPGFRDKLVEYNGLGAVVYAIRCRRNRTRNSRRAREEASDDGTEIMYSILRDDVVISRVQSVLRARVAKLRVEMLRKQKDAADSYAKEVVSSKSRKSSVYGR